MHAIDIDGNATITYAGSSTAPYILDGGGLWEQHTVATGTNVTWYLTSDSTHAYEPCGGVEMNIDPTSPNTLTLSAPTSGPYTGLLMVRDRSSAICTDNAPEIELQPNTANLTGVVYFPYDHLRMQRRGVLVAVHGADRRNGRDAGRRRRRLPVDDIHQPADLVHGRGILELADQADGDR